MSVSLPHRWRIADRHEAEAAGVPLEKIVALPAEPVIAAQFLHAAAWAETDLGDGWIAAYRLAAQNGHPVISELRVFPNVWGSGQRPPGDWSGAYLGPDVQGVPSGGLSATALRKVVLGRSLREALGSLTRLQAAFPSFFSTEAPLAPLARREPRARRARQLDELTLARIAETFVKTDSLRAVAEKFHISKSTARGRIDLARQRGLLERAGKQGVRDSRRLTPAAERLLSRSGRRKS